MRLEDDMAAAFEAGEQAARDGQPTSANPWRWPRAPWLSWVLRRCWLRGHGDGDPAKGLPVSRQLATAGIPLHWRELSEFLLMRLFVDQVITFEDLADEYGRRDWMQPKMSPIERMAGEVPMAPNDWAVVANARHDGHLTDEQFEQLATACGPFYDKDDRGQRLEQHRGDARGVLAEEPQGTPLSPARQQELDARDREREARLAAETQRWRDDGVRNRPSRKRRQEQGGG